MINKKIRIKIIKRDNYSCQKCKRNFEDMKMILHIHHLDGNPLNNHQENLITLCNKCHIKIHSVVWYFVKDKNGKPEIKKYLPLAYARLTISDENKFREAQKKFIKGELPAPTQKQLLELNEKLGII